jgi:hypothetical protein
MDKFVDDLYHPVAEGNFVMRMEMHWNQSYYRTIRDTWSMWQQLLGQQTNLEIDKKANFHLLNFSVLIRFFFLTSIGTKLSHRNSDFLWSGTWKERVEMPLPPTTTHEQPLLPLNDLSWHTIQWMLTFRRKTNAVICVPQYKQSKYNEVQMSSAV